MADSFHIYLEKEKLIKLRPVNKQVIVKLKDDRGEHNGILTVAKINPLIPDRGLVIAIAEDLENKEIVIGSKVIFEKYMGKKIFTDDNETYLIINEEHIHCILPDDFDIGIKYDCKL
jgi:co-chaperonin GroES (HSP10)